jgi:cytochrome P450
MRRKEELLVIVLDLWMAGMETTVTTMKWAILFMLRRPKVESFTTISYAVKVF